MNKFFSPQFNWAHLYIILFITFLIYWSGLDSAFILDDIVNLNTIGQYQHLGYWHDFFLFLLNGDSGPTGRPISLASFYLNDNSWDGADPASFKYTNVLLHLLNGALIFFFIYKITKLYNFESIYKKWLPLLTTTLWLIAPLHTTTVLYVIQRMTELVTFFTLCSLISYIYLRESILLEKKIKTFTWLALFILNFVFAFFSKENGILISAYLLILEYILLKKLAWKKNLNLEIFILFFGWIPLIFIILFLIKAGWIDEHGRTYTTTERLLTESRIIWNYLAQIVIPQSSYISLLHDDFNVSQSLFTPLTTFFSLIGIIVLLLISWLYRNKVFILSFGIFWFFSGHLLESTTVALELYFEHRNYLPMLGINFTLSYYVLSLIKKKKYHHLSISFIILYIFILGFATYNLSIKWTKPIDMVSSWLANHPNSQRTLEALDFLIGEKVSTNDRQKILSLLDKSAQESNTGSYLVFRNLTIQCQQNKITSINLQVAINQLRQSGFALATPSVFTGFLSTWLTTNCGELSAETMLNFIAELKGIKHLQKGTFPHTLDYWQGEVQVKQGNLAQAIQAFEASYALHKDLDLLLIQAIYLHTAGLDEAAEKKLTLASSDLCNNWRQCWILKLRQGDIDSVRNQLTIVQKKANNNEQAVHHSTGEKRS